MSTSKPTSLYRSILREALSITWKRKAVWVFGLFAGLLSTGGVIDMTMHSFQRAVHQGTLLGQLSDRTFIGYRVCASYIQQLHVLGISRTSWLIIACTLVIIGLVVASVISQIALLINSRSTIVLHPHHLRREAYQHFWGVFSINVLTKISTALLVMVTSLPFLLYILESSTQNFWFVFVDTLLFLPLIIIINILSILSLIDCVDHGSKPLEAVMTSIRLFRKQWVATFEFGLVLFLSVLLLGVGLITVGSLLLIPYGLIYSISLLSGSITLFLLSNILFGIAAFALLLMFAGAIVTFQYTAWHRFYKHAMHKQHGAKVFSKIARLLRRS